MPHVILDCSANIASVIDVDGLVADVHAAALATGVAAADALRTRAHLADSSVVADGDSSNMFVAATARLGPGRTRAEQRALVEAIADAIDGRFGAERATLMVSVECQEIDPDRRINRNHLRASGRGTSGV